MTGAAESYSWLVMLFPTAGRVTATARRMRSSGRTGSSMLSRRVWSSMGRGMLRGGAMLSRRRVLSGMLGTRRGSVVLSRMGLGMLGPFRSGRAIGGGVAFRAGGMRFRVGGSRLAFGTVGSAPLASRRAR